MNALITALIICIALVGYIDNLDITNGAYGTVVQQGLITITAR